MARIGAEVEELAALGPVLAEQGAALDGLRATIDGRIGAVWWEGPAHERFVAQWEAMRPGLAALREALDAAGREARSVAEAIRAAGG